MKKYTNESPAGRAMAERIFKPEVTPASRITPQRVQEVDTSVRVGPRGDQFIQGYVDINSPAYTGKFK